MNSFYAEMKLLMPAICYRQLAARLEAPTQRGLAAPVGRVADVSETHNNTLLLMNSLFQKYLSSGVHPLSPSFSVFYKTGFGGEMMSVVEMWCFSFNKDYYFYYGSST
ncbi:hypothetical protein AMECASPLE_021226 [Ameca splendens]|uniref:Uncharacterized protein n=1 Tax=Ameca splendens TaxID=208324 RepID=A0ABV0Y3E1_9TELE